MKRHTQFGVHQTFRILDFVHLQDRLTVLFFFSDVFILRFPYLYSMTHIYSYVVVIPSHSFLPLSTLGRMFTPNMAARITTSTWTHFLWLSRAVITGVTKAHRDSLGLCLLILQRVAYFNYQFPVLSNSHSLILKLRVKISSCIMSKSRLISL